MKIKNYKLYPNWVDLTLIDNSTFRLWLNEWSGKIIYRYKINTISNVKHPGICLGFDKDRNWYYMHNHFEHSGPAIEIDKAFAKGHRLFLETRQSQYNSSIILQRGLNEMIQSKTYHWHDYNCQSYVNTVCFNENRSQSIDEWKSALGFGALLFFGFGVLKNIK